MDRNIKHEDEIKNRIHLSVSEEYSNFLKVHSLELKFLVPWSQYEENNFVNKRSSSEKKIRYDKKDLVIKQNIEFLGAEEVTH